tara:strand:+ start:1814 stop:2908 length:1095 start_codon:yes stop_codon:yes gene_type:complete
LAGSYRASGKFDSAKKTYQKIIEIDKTNTLALRLIIDYLDTNELVEHEKRLNESELKNIKDEKKIDLFFALGILYENFKKFKISAKYFKDANNLKREIYPYNFKLLNKHFDNLEKVFSQLAFEKINIKKQKKIIFVIGLPRSGTSLIEAILSANKNIYPAGEISNLKKIVRENFVINGILDLNKISESINKQNKNIYELYINQNNLKNINKNIIIDKNTENFKFIGIINTFFKNSKIINCVRDPFENFCSLYKINFNSSELNWTNSRSEIVNYHKRYFNLIDLWKSKRISNIIDINFEELLLNPKQTIDKLLDFCGLEKNYDYNNFYKSKSLLIKTASANQVRKSIQKENVFKYEKFKNYLDFN